MIKAEVVIYKGYENSIRLSNGEIELIALTDVGPRIIRYGFIDGPNELCEVEEDLEGLVEYDEDVWKLYGGHRLWHSPEASPRTTLPDNNPVDFEIIEDGFILIQSTEELTGIKKKMTVVMNEDGSVDIKHELINEGLWPVELAVWAITVMAPGGLEVIKHPNRDTGLLANRTLSIWSYSRMNDERVAWGNKYIFLKQSKEFTTPFKIGLPNEHGFAAYFNNNNLFIKKHKHILEETYPDFNCSYETYVCDYMLEMETLSPLVILSPGKAEAHFEHWQIYKNVAMPSSEDEADKCLEKYI